MKINPDFLRQQIRGVLIEHDLADDDALREDMLEGLTDIKEVLAAILKANRDDSWLLTGADVALAEIKERKARLERRVASRRAMILKVMQWASLKRIELPEATLSQRAGQPKLIGEPDVSLLPEELVKVTRAPDRTKIREALLRGDFVPECSLSNAEPTLAILPK
jgi:hypothetical protein